jgi:hypothetical protein
MNFITSFKQSKYYTLDTLLNVLVVLNLLFMVKVVYYVSFLHHLPPPFYYEPNNTFFDFFEVNRKSLLTGIYGNSNPNYLPFVFSLGRLLSPLHCDVTNAYNFRSCALPSILWMVGFYVVAALLLGRFLKATHHIQNNVSQLLKVDFIVLTSPMFLFALERGNYIILTLLLLVLYEFVKPMWARTLLAILLINLKIYMAIILLPMFLKGHFKKVALILLGVVVSNIATSHLLDYDFKWTHFIYSLYHFEAPIHIGGHAPIGYLTERLWTNVSVENLLKIMVPESLETACSYVGTIPCQVLKVLSILRLDLFWKLGVAMVSSITVIMMSMLYKKHSASKILSEEMMLFYLILSLMMFVSHIGAYVLILLVPYFFLLPRYNLGVIISFIILFTTLADIPFYPSSSKAYFSFIDQVYFTSIYTIQISSYLRPLALTYLFYFYSKLIIETYLKMHKEIKFL